MKQSVLDRISLLITAYKCDDLVRRCIDSLVESCGGVLPELAVVDDAGGQDSTEALARSYAKYGVKFARRPTNGGFAGANNFGYPLCTKEYAILVNSDTVFHEEPFSAMLAFMDTHPNAAICQGTVVLNQGAGARPRLDDCGIYMTRAGLRLCLSNFKDFSDPVFSKPFQVFQAYGALFLIRRGLEKEVGGTVFYDHFHTYYEETDLCHRAWLAGREVWYVPTPPVDHAHGATMRKHFASRSALAKQARNKRFSFLTCFGLYGRLTVVPVFELLSFFQAVGGLLRGRADSWRANWQALREIRSMRAEIRKTRGIVQGFRKLDDRSLFKLVMRPYPLREFIRSARQSV